MLELDLIQQFYGTRVAKRSGVPLINHIHEGLAILNEIGASDFAKRAWCLHPMFQADEDLSNNFYLVDSIHPTVIMVVMEYRNKANAWLSDKVVGYSDDIQFIGEPKTGPLIDVRHMLIADKVQNVKDFLEYHATTHDRAFHLAAYFDKWLALLDISQTRYQHLCSVMEGSCLTQS